MSEYGGLERGLFHSVSNHLSRRQEAWQNAQQKVELVELVLGMSGSSVKVVMMDGGRRRSRRGIGIGITLILKSPAQSHVITKVLYHTLV